MLIMPTPRRRASGGESPTFARMRRSHPELASLEKFEVAFACYTRDGRALHASRGVHRIAARGEAADLLVAEVGVAVRAAGAARAEARGIFSSRSLGATLPLPVPTLGARASARMAWVRTERDGVVVVVLFVPPEPGGGEQQSELNARLSPREREVAACIARGASTKEIALELGISPHTARRHTERVFGKCGVRCRAALAAAMARG